MWEYEVVWKRDIDEWLGSGWRLVGSGMEDGESVMFLVRSPLGRLRDRISRLRTRLRNR